MNDISTNAGSITIAPYRVKEDRQTELFEVLKEKRQYFSKAGYITSRLALLLRSRIDKEVLLEVFEWPSEKRCEEAHDDPQVNKFWNKMYELWEEGGFGLKEIEESKLSFAHFDPLDIYDQDKKT